MIVEGCGFENSFSVWVPFWAQGRIRQRKERDGLHLSYAVPEIGLQS